MWRRLDSISIQEPRKVSSAHFGARKCLNRLRIISDRIGQVLEWRSENAQSSSEGVRVGEWFCDGWSRVWRGRGCVCASMRRQESQWIKELGQTVQAKSAVVVGL